MEINYELRYLIIKIKDVSAHILEAYHGSNRIQTETHRWILPASRDLHALALERLYLQLDLLLPHPSTKRSCQEKLVIFAFAFTHSNPS